MDGKLSSQHRTKTIAEALIRFRMPDKSFSQSGLPSLDPFQDEYDDCNQLHTTTHPSDPNQEPRLLNADFLLSTNQQGINAKVNFTGEFVTSHQVLPWVLASDTPIYRRLRLQARSIFPATTQPHRNGVEWMTDDCSYDLRVNQP